MRDKDRKSAARSAAMYGSIGSMTFPTATSAKALASSWKDPDGATVGRKLAVSWCIHRSIGAFYAPAKCLPSSYKRAKDGVAFIRELREYGATGTVSFRSDRSTRMQPEALIVDIHGTPGSIEYQAAVQKIRDRLPSIRMFTFPARGGNRSSCCCMHTFRIASPANCASQMTARKLRSYFTTSLL